MAKGLGMGVAVITKMCGATFAFFHNLARWATPKRCCSSMTARPNLWNTTLGSIKAWVPTKMSTTPASRASKISRRALPFTEPVKSSTRTGMSPSISLNPSRCCCAKISVGAIIAAWNPLSMASSAINNATTVLPLPTSPWSSRFMWRPVFKSARISLNTRFWAPVNSKGSFS